MSEQKHYYPLVSDKITKEKYEKMTPTQQAIVRSRGQYVDGSYDPDKGGRGYSKANRILRRARIAMALQLREAGHDYATIKETVQRHFEKRYEKIGETFRYSERKAYKDVCVGIRRLENKLKDTAESVLRMELDRLDKMLSKLYPLAMGTPEVKDSSGKVIQKAVPPNMKAADRILKIMERRSKFLGLDAPESFRVEMEQHQSMTIAVLRDVSLDDL